MKTMPEKADKQLKECLKLLNLKTMYEQIYSGVHSELVTADFKKGLLELLEEECSQRDTKRIERLLRESRIPQDKKPESFLFSRIPVKARRIMDALMEGSFLKRCENVLVFGRPGSGKTHFLCALGQILTRQGHRIYFTKCSFLVEELLKAKKELNLEKYIKRLSRYSAVIIDDIGYVQYDREEMEVLFTFLASRYERGSIMLTSNLPFSKWDSIFKDAMTTAAAIDRLVHHSVILELNVKSYRMEKAGKENPLNH